jgi:hypothetical protein
MGKPPTGRNNLCNAFFSKDLAVKIYKPWRAIRRCIILVDNDPAGCMQLIFSALED